MILRGSQIAAMVFCLLLAGRAGFGQQDQPIYDNALENSWTSWSWATVGFSSTVSPHSGSYCISVSVGVTNYSALYLHHDAFDTRVYSNLTFWIRGVTNGALVLVQATLSTVQQTAINLPALTTNWTQYALSLASLGVTNKTDMDGFWIKERVGAAALFYVDDIKLTAIPAPAVVHISVMATQTIRIVDARYFGLNAAIWDSVFDTPDTISLLTALDNRVMRFPGGSAADEYHWASNKTGTNTWTWATSFDNFMHVATNTWAQAFITVNYGSGSAAEAAAWVRYANITNGAGFKYWEIGNENYGNWETDTNARPNDPFTYAKQFKNYAAQMKSVDPTIKVGAVAETGEDSYPTYTDHPATNSRTHLVHHGWTPVMLTTLKGLGVTPDFLIYHRYAQSAGEENDAGLLQSSGTWPGDAADLRGQWNDYFGEQATNVELVCTENNSVYTNPGKQSTSLVNGLFLADSVAQAMMTEFNAVLWWDLRNAQETTNNNSAALYGWRNYGDYGITDSSNPSSAVNHYPTFYAAKLLKYFARGGDRLVPATSDYSLLAAYAAERTNGFLTLLVINKSATSNLNANIAIAGYSFATNMPVFVYGIQQDNAASTNNNAGADIAITNATFQGTNVNCTFPPYSITVLALAGESVVRITALDVATTGMGLAIQGLPGLHYDIGVSTDLVSWTPLVTNTLAGAGFNWLDTDVDNTPVKFYRSAWLP